MAISQVYNAAEVSLVVNSVAITDLSGDVAISVELPTESSTLEVGLNRSMTSFGSKRSGSMTLTCLPSSQQQELFKDLFNAQTTGGGQTFQISLRTGVGGGWAFNRCSFAGYGELQTGGQSAKNRTFKFNFEDVTPPQFD